MERMIVRNELCLHETIKVDDGKNVDVRIDCYGIQREDFHRMEETVVRFLHSVEEILKTGLSKG